jgi:cellulose synthase/poly-beta-1,6-N-acetylglucosamine synthase-like glycosyltransferase
MYFFIIIAVFFGLVYALFLCIIIFALSKVKSGKSSECPSVSVVIAAHNEKDDILPCLKTLKHQDYDGFYEVIVADDRSDDGTSDLLAEACRIWPQLRIIRIDRAPDGISPKKNSLSRAIQCAKGEIILLTDADCIVPEGWISGMVRRFEQGVGMVAGIAPYYERPGILNSFIRHEYLWNAALSAGSIALGHGTHASGRNLGFRRDLFLELDGYGESARILSGDDTLLLHRIQQSHSGLAVTQPDTPTHVYTEAPKTFSAFLSQRLRHMSTGKFFEPFHIFSGVVIYSYHLLLVLTLVFSPIIPFVFMVFLISFIWKILLDGIVAWKVQSILKLSVQWNRFVLNELFLLFYMAAIPVIGTIVPAKWKQDFTMLVKR